jgi:plastocyanin
MLALARIAGVCSLVCSSVVALGQEAPAVEVRAHLAVSQAQGKPSSVHAVLWLQPRLGTVVAPKFKSSGSNTLLQKDRMFTPHLLVVPVGAIVHFPNADPYYHNVFSLFNGRRFDLGLYEAGSKKDVSFDHEGVSYIFCNIHPEMSAVVLALSTPLYSVADKSNTFLISGVPAGEYQVHIWMEGASQSAMEKLNRTVHVSSDNINLGDLHIALPLASNPAHENKFGQDYERDPHELY